MARQTGPRLYARTRGGVTRYYADFRALGGDRQPLCVPGEKLATNDLALAKLLLAERWKAWEARRLSRAMGIEERPATTLADFARAHLMAKAQQGRTSERWLAQSELYLRRAVAFFGADRDLASIEVEDVERWMGHLATMRTRTGGKVKPGTILHHLVTLSNLYKRAGKRRLVPRGHNPVADLEERPRVARVEAGWLEVHEAAFLLEAARLMPRPPRSRLVPFLHPLLATFLLTGGRFDEVTGLQVEDVSLERATVRFWPNPFRRGKKGKSHGAERVVPLWPQLQEILGDYLATRPPSRLLFPAWRGGQEGPVADLRGALRALERFAGLPEGRITTKAFRHTYTSARLQTLDRGAPVALRTVAWEMGHADIDLVQRVYGHLGTIRHRAEVVEYRAEQHTEALGDRLGRLRVRAGGGTKEGTTQRSTVAPRPVEVE